MTARWTTPGCTVWFTGLPSSGKTTLSRLLERKLRAHGVRVEVLDGDAVRENLSKGLGFSREDRDTHILRVGYVCGLLARHGVVAIAAAISPYRATRDAVRAEAGRFVEVYVDCPLEECIRRDVKGLYRRALNGEIPNFTGVSDPYEPPFLPEVALRTDRSTAEECAEAIIERLFELGYLQDGGAFGGKAG